MTFWGFLVFLVIAAFCGAIGQRMAGYSLGGCFVSIIVGFIGAWLGPMIADKLNMPEFFTITIQGQEFPIVWSIIGSAVFAFIVGIITRGRKEETT
ncbi:MAG: hypothetical protein A2V66_00665 [Ignavibacteria bacterium RBG_13_36_8]|nr:MAG: hypothetical protein A2V66_00665 [Ignavibacteria bacterium RBG_13_36_8]